jgi:hypothetical protein
MTEWIRWRMTVQYFVILLSIPSFFVCGPIYAAAYYNLGAFLKGPSYATPALVNSTTYSNGGNTSYAVTVPSSSTGNLLVFAICPGAIDDNVSSVSDNGSGGGNSWVSANARSTDVNGGSCEIWYAKNSKAAATTLTLNMTTSANLALWYAEFSGIDTSIPLDSVNTTSGHASSTTVTAPSVTPTISKAVIFSASAVQNTITALHSGSPFTALTITSGDDAAYLVSSSIAAYGAAWDQNSSGTYCASTAAFKAKAQ